MKEKLGSIFDGFVLLAIGGFISFLIFAGNYWYYLNPKFERLTGLTAALLILTGLATIIRSKRSLSISRTAVFLVFIAVLAIGTYSGIPRAPQAQADLSQENSRDEEPRITLSGVEYIKINLAELLWISDKQFLDKLNLHYVVRGIVKRSGALDELGYFALVRSVMTCCLADSMGLGLPVRDSRVKDFSDGQWVAVYGTLERLGEKVPREGLRPGRMRLITLSRNYGLVPAKIEKIDEPDSPFIFETKDEEPYAY